MKILPIIILFAFVHGSYASDVMNLLEKERLHTEASVKLFQSEDETARNEGFQYLLHESKEGSAYSTGKIGWAYQMGWGVKKDIDKAKELYLSAANSGMTYWQYLLAHAYQQGYLGLEKSEVKYKYWLNYKPKIHTAKYECWVANYYDMGIYPENHALQSQYRATCSES